MVQRQQHRIQPAFTGAGIVGAAEDSTNGIGEGATEPIDVDEGVEKARDGANVVGVNRAKGV